MTSAQIGSDTSDRSPATLRDLLVACICGIVAGSLAFLAYRTSGLAFLPLATASAAALVSALRLNVITTTVEAFSTNLERVIARLRASDGRTSKIIVLPVATIVGFFNRIISRIRDHHVRAAVRIATGLIVVEVTVIAVIASVMLAIGLLIFLGVLYLSFKILQLSGHLPQGSEKPRKNVPLDFAGTSRKQTTILGLEEYEEFVDAQGNVSHTSHRETDILGRKYTQLRDADGNEIGREDARTSFIGEPFVEVSDADGKAIGERRIVHPFIGDPVAETTDEHGRVVSRATKQRTIVGEPYREHGKP